MSQAAALPGIDPSGGGPLRVWQTVDSPTLGKRIFIKRSTLLPDAVGTTNAAGIPYKVDSDRWRERLQNEVKAIQWIKENIPSIPVPNILCSFDDLDCTFVVMEYVENAMAADFVPKDKYHIVQRQLDKVVEKLRQPRFRRAKCESFTGKPFFPVRFRASEVLSNANYVQKEGGYVMCHNDLAAHNVLVDPETFEIRCIIDWEFSSWMPEEIIEVWPRSGPVWRQFKEDPDDVDAVTNKLFYSTKPDGGNAVAPVMAEPRSLGSGRDMNLDKIRWDPAILPRPYHVPDKPLQNTVLKRRLDDLDIGHPESIPMTSRSLALNVLMTTRAGMAENFERLANDSVLDHRAMEVAMVEMDLNSKAEWLAGGPRALLSDSYTHLRAAEAIFPHICRLLAKSSTQSLLAAVPLWKHLFERDSKGKEAWEEHWSMDTRSHADVAFNAMHTLTWKGYAAAGAELLRVSLLALALIDETATIDTGTHRESRSPAEFGNSRSSSPRKDHLEARLEDILAGGDGAFDVGVHDGTTGVVQWFGRSTKLPTRAEAQERFPMRAETDKPREDLKGHPYPHPSQREEAAWGVEQYPWPLHDAQFEGVHFRSVRVGKDPMPQAVDDSLRRGQVRATSSPNVRFHIASEPSGSGQDASGENANAQGSDPEIVSSRPISKPPAGSGVNNDASVHQQDPAPRSSHPDRDSDTASQGHHAKDVGWAGRKLNKVARLFGVNRSSQAHTNVEQ